MGVVLSPSPTDGLCFRGSEKERELFLRLPRLAELADRQPEEYSQIQKAAEEKKM
jgi:hypothetical protein